MAVKRTTNSLPDKPDKEAPEPKIERVGSIRKFLSSLVGGDSLISLFSKMIDKKTQPKGRISERYSHFMREYPVITEFNIMCKNLLPGVYVIPSANSGFVWFGVVFVRNGIYKGGIFKFNVRIPENYPDTFSPTVDFDTRVFHPSVDEETQELNIRLIFPEWSRQANHIWQILEYTRSIFYEINTLCPFNYKAAKMYENDYEQYVKLAEECVEESKRTAFEISNPDDPHSFCFSEFDESVHRPILNQLRDPKQVWREESPSISHRENGTSKPYLQLPSS
ncbi:protein AKTIP homolog isoform X2 [Cimex lectularius]|uniref:UBC core domain-containing protein n=1 Tax=Cimex lectularius TaxID=79782 RepID=A0A8I6RVN4_CIMLE|nr:protein AKTIP homolog isoform X2 [Cimex lectularius]